MIEETKEVFVVLGVTGDMAVIFKEKSFSVRNDIFNGEITFESCFLKNLQLKKKKWGEGLPWRSSG